MDSTTIYSLTNKYRQSLGLSSLTLDSRLSHSALVKARDLCETGYWSHDRPDGTSWTDNIASHYPYTKAGENLAKGFNNDRETINGWKSSPGHNENMLNDWEDIGVATYYCGDVRISVQHFGTIDLAQTDTTGNTMQVWITLPILLLTICIIFYKIYTIIRGKHGKDRRIV